MFLYEFKLDNNTVTIHNINRAFRENIVNERTVQNGGYKNSILEIFLCKMSCVAGLKLQLIMVFYEP